MDSPDQRQFLGMVEIGDNIHIEMKNEFIAARVNAFERHPRCRGRAFPMHFRGRKTSDRQAAKKVFFGRIETLDAKESDVRIAHKRRLAPESHQLGSAAARQMRNDHSIHAARRRR